MRWIVIVFLVLVSAPLFAQDVEYVFADVEVKITGTSTLHDWTVEASEVIDYPESLMISSSAGEIDSFSFRVAVASMDGGRGPSMNNKIYKALLSDDHPYIHYVQTKPAVLAETGDESSLISMAGVSQEYEVEVSVLSEGDQLQFTTARDIQLSDFGIEPPSAMFGQIKTGDDITVHFTFTYHRS